jgi:hypothetical protein
MPTTAPMICVSWSEVHTTLIDACCSGVTELPTGSNAAGEGLSQLWDGMGADESTAPVSHATSSSRFICNPAEPGCC